MNHPDDPSDPVDDEDLTDYERLIVAATYHILTTRTAVLDNGDITAVTDYADR